MKRTLFARTLLISMLTSALLSFTACKTDEDKTDEDKCKEGDLVACVKAAVKEVDKRAASATNESKDDGNENSSTGTLVDKRDGKKYKTVKIGYQMWMAENLNYKMPDSYCYKDDESNCKKYGRLYKWESAKMACPSGWHLPSRSEFKTLFESVGGQWGAGKSLKSKNGWNNSSNGTDSFGFSALPAGGRGNDGEYGDEGSYANFWTSTEYESGHNLVYSVGFNCYDDNANVSYEEAEVLPDDDDRIYGFSVRCLKN